MKTHNAEDIYNHKINHELNQRSIKKIGIVTFNDAYNYGAFLQEYALQTFLEKYFSLVEVVNYTNLFFSQQYLYTNNIFKKKGLSNKLKIIYNFLFRHKVFLDRLTQKKNFLMAIKNEIKLSPSFTYEKKEQFNNRYDYFIAGSDQVWNVLITHHDKFYFLDFVKDSKKKRTYAVSLGRSSFDKEIENEIIGNINGFNNILIREDSGKKLLEKHGINSEVVLDPTFLLTREQWEAFAKKSDIELPKKYIVIYIVAEQTRLLEYALQYADDNECEIIIMSDKNRNISYKGRTIKAAITCGPYDFVKYIAYADMVFTTSFHGMVLSINLNTPFYYELCRAKCNNNARLESISKQLQLSVREITDEGLSKCKIDWDKTNNLLYTLRNRSVQMLINSLR